MTPKHIGFGVNGYSVRDPFGADVVESSETVPVKQSGQQTVDEGARANDRSLAVGPSPTDISKLSGLSINGVNLWGDNKSIEAAMRWEHDHAIIGDIRTNLAHWRGECGKLHAKNAVLNADLAEAVGAIQPLYDNLTEAVVALMAAELVLTHTGHEGSLVLMQVRAVIAKSEAPK